jgi:WD40 repeat protein
VAGPEQDADTAREGERADAEAGAEPRGESQEPVADTLQRASLSTILPDGECDFAEVRPECYELEREFARGGLGRILRATDRRLRRRVALKELISKDGKAEQRFVREALITARLEHPGIVPVHEAGRWPSGKRFYAMKLVEGRTLARALEVAHSVEERLALVPHLIDVAEAVAYAHSQGILHRDLKPGNVMVGAFGETVLIDWGLAKDLRNPSDDSASADGVPSEDVGRTSDGIVVGTPPYMPPEQAGGHAVDERSDVYALGAMLYHALSGRRPYAEVRSRDILLAVVSGPPKPLKSLAPDVPRELVAIADKAMARDPDDRYPSAKEMAEELRRFTTGQLVGAHHYSSWELLSRFVRRNAGTLSVAAAALLVLAALGIFSFDRIRRERNAAMTAEAETARRNQALILSQAELNLDRDPSLSLAWLKELDQPLPGAASVAAEAVARGVARHVVRGHVKEVDVVSASASGRRAASGDRTGRIRWIDVGSGEVRALDGHTDRVTALRFSPDASVLVSASYDETVRAWRLDDGTSRVVATHEGDVKDVVYVGTDRIASISVDGELRLTDIASGEPVWTANFDDASRFLVVRVSADGRRLATGGHRGRVRLWRATDGRLVRTLACDPGGEVTVLELSSDGRQLVCGGVAGELRSFDLATDTSVALAGHTTALESLALSPDGTRAVSSDVGGRVARWRPPASEPHWLESVRGRVASAVFSPDGDRFALGGWDGEIHVLGPGGQPPVTLRGHGGRVAALAGLRGDRLVSGSWDRQMRIWTLPPAASRVLEGHTVGVHAVDVSSDGRWIASGGHDETVRLWGVETGTERVFRGHTDHVYRVLFSPDDRWVASSSDDRTVRMWSVEGSAQRVLRGHEADVEELAFSSDGRWLASAGEDDRAFLWDVATGEGRALEAHTDHVTDVAFRPNASELASAGRDGRVIVWPIGGGAPRIFADGEAEVGSVTYTRDGRHLAAARLDGAVDVFDAESGSVSVRYDGLERASLVRFSPDGRYLAVGSRSTALWLCLRSYQRCSRLPEHSGDIRDLAFDERGVVLVSAASGDGDNLRLWDTETEEYRILRGHRFDVFSVAVFPTGDRVVSGSGDADVRVWPVRLPPRPDGLQVWLREHTSVRVPAESLVRR